MLLVFFVSLQAALCFIVDSQENPIQLHDLNSIVKNIKKDLDHHLKLSAKQNDYDHPAVVADIDDFMTMIQDSMQYHLMKTLNPSDTDIMSTMQQESTELDDSSLEMLSRNANDETLESSSSVYEMHVGSMKAIPGVHFPDYDDIPMTSFACSDKLHFPGFYADMDTRCQVFHVCWPDRRESFLCPTGTTFNQALLVCDYWYNSNCTLSAHYYSMNSEIGPSSSGEETSTMINALLEKNSDKAALDSLTDRKLATISALSFIAQFVPIKAKIVLYPETAKQRPKIVASYSIGDKKVNLSSKSRPKNKHSTSKPVGPPLSGKRMATPTIDDHMTKLKSKIFAVKFSKALDRIILDAKADNSLSKIFWYIEKTVNFLKSILDDYMQEMAVPYSFEPQSELYEYDLLTTEAFEKLPVFTKDLLMSIAAFIDEIGENVQVEKQTGSPQTPVSFERGSQYDELDIKIDPRLDTKPTTKEDKLGEQDKPLASEKIRVKRSSTIVYPLKISRKDSPSIHPGTKKVLLKNYIKLFKTKYI